MTKKPRKRVTPRAQSRRRPTAASGGPEQAPSTSRPKSARKPAVPRSMLEGQIERDRILFQKLSLNIRRARREELEAVWPEAYLPEAEEPQLPLDATKSQI